MLQLIRKFGADGAFNPEELALLVAAFEAAWQQVETSGARFESAEQREHARSVIGRCIIDQAKTGVRDHLRLREAALLRYGEVAGRAKPD